MNQNQARAIASAVGHIRPDWQSTSVVAMLERLPPHRRNLPARDVMLALVWLAYDPDTKTPGRLTADGPWWHLAETAARAQAAPEDPTSTRWCRTHQRPYLHECRYCRDAESIEGHGSPPTPEQRAIIRDAILAAQDKPKERIHPVPGTPGAQVTGATESDAQPFPVCPGGYDPTGPSGWQQ